MLVPVHEKQGGSTMTMRPDPTFHASPKLAMEAPPENFAYTLLLSPDISKPDALAVIDVKSGSPTYGQVVHTVTMPYRGDEFHHFGWNACSSALSPLTGHAFLERRYLIIPGIRSSRIYVVDTKPDPTKAKIHKIIEPEEVFKKTGYSRPHTVHCGPEGIYVSTLGGSGKNGTDGPPGVFIMDCETFDILGRWEIDRRTVVSRFGNVYGVTFGGRGRRKTMKIYLAGPQVQHISPADCAGARSWSSAFTYSELSLVAQSAWWQFRARRRSARGYVMPDDRGRFQKVLAIAINPGAYEAEAIAALRKARTFVKIDPSLAHPPPPPPIPAKKV